MYKITIILFWLMGLFMPKAQSINMFFPHFAGKTYNFIIFQGSQQKTVYQGTIPANGRFTLTIPKEYAPYTGMSRWLITNSQTGGGLNMFISGKDFSVSSESSQPNDDNITYSNNSGNEEMDALYIQQDQIMKRYEAMLQAKNAFILKDKNFPVFIQEYNNQKKAYETLHKTLTGKGDYVSQFTQIVNITRGLGTQLLDKEKERADNIAAYITNNLNWQYLYTSGLWDTVINSWLDIHTRVLQDPVRFSADFQEITSKINSSALYTEFAGDVAKVLSRKGDDDYIGYIAPIVTTSGKVAAYDGALAFYVKGTVGAVAPDLIVSPPVSNSKNNKSENKRINLKVTGKDFKSTLLIFYQSEDINSMEILKQLSAKYEMLKASGVRVIALSADSDEKVFRSKSQDFPWEDTYCDYKGAEGENFKNYSVTGVPTLILTGINGEILSRGASLSF
ncbi:alkyl hydroperoxide reductase [Elizabethkingia anophelis]|nr:alkyl hydroperoxide reductase [Elizabethkingia anophelis]